MRNLYRHSSRTAIATERLEGAVTADVAVVGGGFTGLSTALHLAGHGLKAVVLEAEEIGHGCSGRNGGQVNPGLKHLPDEVEARFGGDLGRRFSELSFSAPGLVFELIAEHGIDCAPRRSGTIRAAIDQAGVSQVTALAEQCSRRGGAVRLLSADDMKAMTGTPRYRAGALDPRGGHINPLAFTRGLAQAAERAGARLHGQSRARSVRRSSTAWQVTTDNGSVAAPTLVICTNGYTDGLWPGLQKTIAPIYSYIAATDPLPESVMRTIMPSGSALYEASWDVIYYRLDDEGRLLMGGRGPQREARGDRDYRHLIDYALKLWPQLDGIAWPWSWHGQVAITRDHFPHLTTPEDGVHLMLGYNGRGIAMATASGREVAKLIASDGKAEIALPVRTALDQFPFHGFWRMGATLTVAAHRLQDRLRRR
ncbi:MAG: FAD-binding oxidoreductase [Alphaproteobacteria bacterium]